VTYIYCCPIITGNQILVIIQIYYHVSFHDQFNFGDNGTTYTLFVAESVVTTFRTTQAVTILITSVGFISNSKGMTVTRAHVIVPVIFRDKSETFSSLIQCHKNDHL